jgi:CubicO group peptidase (beta-lactamase class C family)
MSDSEIARVARKDGEKLSDYVPRLGGTVLSSFQTHIFDPLGMRDITFWPMSRNVYFRGSGGLYSSAEGYVPLGIMLSNGGELGGKRLLSRKSVEMLSAVHIPDTLPGRPSGEGYGLSVRVVTNHAARGLRCSRTAPTGGPARRARTSLSIQRNNWSGL